MSITEILKQIHDEADHITGMDRLIESIVIADAKAIKRLAKKGLKELNSKVTRVRKWIRCGELSPSNTAIEDVIQNCGRALDHNGAPDILGDVLFQATNGKYYVINVEAIIQEANPEYVKDVLAEEKNNQ